MVAELLRMPSVASLRRNHDAHRIVPGVVSGTVVDIEAGVALIEIGLSMPGRVAMGEFSGLKSSERIQVGSEVEVWFDRVDPGSGEPILSRDRARNAPNWRVFARRAAGSRDLQGRIIGPVAGGFRVDLSGVVALLPTSHLDLGPVHDVESLKGVPLAFRVIEVDHGRHRVIVSRRLVLEDDRDERFARLLLAFEERSAVHGVVRSVADLEAIVDLGGIEGFLNVRDIGDGRVRRASELLSVDQVIAVEVLAIDRRIGRIRLSARHVRTNPWVGSATRYPAGERFDGRVSAVVDYGVFVELEPGLEGLVHSSEMTWDSIRVRPEKIVSVGQFVHVVVIAVEEAARRASLSLKLAIPDPLESFVVDHWRGSLVDGRVISISPSGMLVDLGQGLIGEVAASNVTTTPGVNGQPNSFEVGDAVRLVLSEIDKASRSICLSLPPAEHSVVPAADRGSRGPASPSSNTVDDRAAVMVVAQALVDVASLDGDAAELACDLAHTSADLGPALAWRTAFNALLRDGRSDDAEKLGLLLHRYLFAQGLDEFVPTLFMAQARSLHSAGDLFGARLYALEAAHGYLARNLRDAASAALDLVQG